MIYVISKSTFGEYGVRDIQCNANWCSCPYSDYALIPDGMVEGILATQGYCDIVLTEDGSEVAAFTAREIPSVPEECWGERTATEAYVDARTMIATDPNNDGNIVLQYGGNVVPGGGGSGGSGGSGIHIGTEPPTDENVEVWIDTDEEAPESGGGSQADWNANEGEPGHVLNRTHYVNGTKPKILLDKTFTVSNNQWMGLGTIPLVVGKTYTAIWDGTEYECEGFTATYMEMDVICIGNPMLLQAGENNNIPFLFGCVYAQNASAVAAMVDGNYTLKITEEVTAYKPLEEGALPSIVLPKVIKLPAGSLGENMTDFPVNVVVSDISYDEFAEHLWNGGELLLDMSDAIPSTYPIVYGMRRKVVDWGAFGDGTSWEFALITTKPVTQTSDGKPNVEYMRLVFETGTWTPPLT